MSFFLHLPETNEGPFKMTSGSLPAPRQTSQTYSGQSRRENRPHEVQRFGKKKHLLDIWWQLPADVAAAEVKRPIYIDAFLRLTPRSAQAAIHEARPEGLPAKSQTKRRPAWTRQALHTWLLQPMYGRVEAQNECWALERVIRKPHTTWWNFKIKRSHKRKCICFSSLSVKASIYSREYRILELMQIPYCCFLDFTQKPFNVYKWSGFHVQNRAIKTLSAEAAETAKRVNEFNRFTTSVCFFFLSIFSNQRRNRSTLIKSWSGTWGRFKGGELRCCPERRLILPCSQNSR